MTLIAHVYGGYASYDGAYEWGNPEHVAHKFVQILKGEEAKGYAMLPRPDGSRIKITTASPSGAFTVWGSWAATKAAELYPTGHVWLVPIPSSGCLTLGGDAKGRALAEAVSVKAANLHMVEALHWRVKLKKAREGGPRDAATLLGNLSHPNPLAKWPVILVDDVVTGGGHAIACAQKLRAAGHSVEHVLAAAKTVKSPPNAGMFNIPAWDLEADPFADLF